MTPVVDDLATLIAFPTVSNRPLVALAAFLAEQFEQLGHHVERFDAPTMDGKCNVVTRVGPKRSGGLVISGHMDVVPTEGQPWTKDPFKLTLDGKQLFGRGTADMKGFFAATLHALKRIPAADFKKELVCIWTHDEEVGCLGSKWLAEHLLDTDHHLPEACLIGEPTGFEMLRMHPGHVAVRFEFTGLAAHSSRPDLGRNAIESAATAIRAIQQLAAELESEARTDLPELERPWVAVNPAQIHGGSAINIVPDQCVLDVGYRHLPGMGPHEVFHRMCALMEEASLDLKAKVLRVTPSLLTDADASLVKVLSPHAAHDHCGAASFATDGGNLAKLGLKPIIFGPGEITVAHKADEYLNIDELHKAVDVVERIIRQCCCE